VSTLHLRAWLSAACFAACAVAHADSNPVPPEHRRSVEQTFLTYPEWFLVHSPAEYATMVAHAPPHQFPFLRHVGQMWSSYGSVIGEQVRQRYPANGGYHLMIGVIAGSTTLEYGLRSAYENSLGRASAFVQTGPMTPEDALAARYAQAYVDFIRIDPWYKFSFTRWLKELWTSVPMVGPDMIRKWERRYALTTELAAKAMYGWLIGLGTASVYDEALPTTYVVVSGNESPLANATPTVDGRWLVALPRYEAFMPAATQLAHAGIAFDNIAGNDRDTPLLVTMIANESWQPPASARVLFTQPMITQPRTRRVAVVIDVKGLAPFLRSLTDQGARLEHIYDY
jgi:hypothetical protein